MNAKMQIAIVAMIIDRYPNSGLFEKVEITSLKMPNAGRIRI